MTTNGSPPGPEVIHVPNPASPRERLAGHIAQALIADAGLPIQVLAATERPKVIIELARASVRIADAIIEELNKEKK
jgi:hypothetical protein